MTERGPRPAEDSGGLSRRTLLRRSAVVGGGLVWAAPVVQSLAAPAFAAGSLPNDISYVALLVTCPGATYRVKLSKSGLECGNNFVVGDCTQTFVHTATVTSCGPTSGSVNGAINKDGSYTFYIPNQCKITDYVVHRGNCCAEPGDAGEPKLSAFVYQKGTNKFTFYQPSTNKPNQPTAGLCTPSDSCRSHPTSPPCSVATSKKH